MRYLILFLALSTNASAEVKNTTLNSLMKSGAEKLSNFLNDPYVAASFHRECEPAIGIEGDERCYKTYDGLFDLGAQWKIVEFAKGESSGTYTLSRSVTIEQEYETTCSFTVEFIIDNSTSTLTDVHDLYTKCS